MALPAATPADDADTCAKQCTAWMQSTCTWKGNNNIHQPPSFHHLLLNHLASCTPLSTLHEVTCLW